MCTRGPVLFFCALPPFTLILPVAQRAPLLFSSLLSLFFFFFGIGPLSCFFLLFVIVAKPVYCVSFAIAVLTANQHSCFSLTVSRTFCNFLVFIPVAPPLINHTKKSAKKLTTDVGLKSEMQEGSDSLLVFYLMSPPAPTEDVLMRTLNKDVPIGFFSFFVFYRKDRSSRRPSAAVFFKPKKELFY